MSDVDFKIGNRKFKLNKISTMDQYHLLRKMGGILSDIIPVMMDIKSKPNENPDDIFLVFVPIMSGLSKLTKQDSEDVLFGFLSSVEMQQGTGNWAKIATVNRLLFEDLSLGILLQIAGRAFGYNFKGFLEESPLTLGA